MRTTINIKYDLLKKLESASDSLKISTDDLIAILLNTAISKNIFKITSFKSIKYQDTDQETNWEKLHITYKPQVYEKSLDIRKVFRVSASLFYSFAILHFLDEIIEELMDSNKRKLLLDNYPLNYIFIANIYDGIQGFIILWGIPEETHLKNFIT